MAQHRIRAVSRPPEPFASMAKTPAAQPHRLGRTPGPPNTADQLRSGAPVRPCRGRTGRHLSLQYGCRPWLRQLHPLVRRRRTSYALTEYTRSCILTRDGQVPAMARVVPPRHQGLPTRSKASCRLPTPARAAGYGAERLEAHDHRRHGCEGDTGPYQDGASGLLHGPLRRSHLRPACLREAEPEDAGKGYRACTDPIPRAAGVAAGAGLWKKLGRR
jgi:hypothetical protein